MSDTDLAAFLDKVDCIGGTSRTTGDRILAKHALIWLCISRRALQNHELVTILLPNARVSECLERLGGEPVPTELGETDDSLAGRYLQSLLGDLVAFTGDPATDIGDGIVAMLAYPGMPTTPKRVPHHIAEAVLPRLGCSFDEGNFIIATFCMNLCSSTTLRCDRGLNGDGNSSLITYAWSHWNTHLAFAGTIPETWGAKATVDSMILEVAIDALVLLLFINEFLVRPMKITGTASRTRTLSVIQQAQQALECPLVLLLALVRKEGLIDAVNAEASPDQGQLAAEGQPREDFEAAKIAEEEAAVVVLKTKMARQQYKPSEKQQPELRQLIANLERRDEERATREANRAEFLALADTHASESEPEVESLTEPYSKAEEQTRLTAEAQEKRVHSLEEIAQALRAVCLSLADPILYDELLREVSEGLSPMHVLARVALMMTRIAGYIRGEDIQVGDQVDIKGPFEVSDPRENNYVNTALVRHYLSNHSNPKDALGCPGCQVFRTMSTHSVKKPACISTTRWRAALIVGKGKSLMLLGHNVERPHTFSSFRALSSFTSIPPQLYMPSVGQTWDIVTWVPAPVRQLLYSCMAWLSAWTSSHGIVTPVHALPPGAFTLDDPPCWTQLKLALLTSGYRVAFLQAMIAIVINHIRRIFVPWVGAFLFQHPLKDLRLALSNPDMFLQQTLSYTWADACFSLLQRWVFDLVALTAMRLVVINNGQLPMNPPVRPNANHEGIEHLAKISCWVYAIVTSDYILCRSLNAASVLLAVVTLGVGGRDAHLALLSCVQPHWTHIPLLAAMTGYYLRHSFCPIIQGSVSSAIRGRPGLLLTLAAVAGGVAAALRLRSKLGFLWLELSNAILVYALLALALVVLGCEFCRDPLGLEGSTAWARSLGSEVKRALPDGAEKRFEIIGKRKTSTQGKGRDECDDETRAKVLLDMESDR